MKKVILAGVCLKDSQSDFDYRMEECRQLCIACGYEPCAEVVQNSTSLDPNTAFRKGKLSELAQMVEETGASQVVFMNDLSVQSAYRIAKTVGVDVIDRTALILDIFAVRARSTQAKLQVEAARLQYALPGVIKDNTDNERSRGGGVTNRGAGEMRSALVARRYRSRIAELKKELKEIEKRRNRDERRRSKTLMRRVALVGYTNAGKSSLMNRILTSYDQKGTQVECRDMLFATLDTSVRSVSCNGYGFLLYDTVGFVSDLPEPLLDAFHSTLASACEADLLIHVIDCSDPDMERKIQATEETLQEIGADEIPVLRVYNKADLVDHPDDGRLYLSCLNGEGLEEVMKQLIDKLYPQEDVFHVFLPYDRMYLFDEYRKVCAMDIVKEAEDGMEMKVSCPHDFADAFAAYRL